MRYLTRALPLIALIATSACTRSDSDSSSSSGSDSDTDSSSNGGDSGAGEGNKPIALTDARLDKYIAYRKELNQCYVRWNKSVVELSKSVDSKSTDLGKGIAAVAGVNKLGELHEKEMTALRAKHGIAEEEDDRLWSAITEVTAAKPFDNPMMGDGLKMYKDMQARGGEEKKTADEILKGFADEEKQKLDAARGKYGDACVDVLSKRSRELSQLQSDLLKDMMTQMQGTAK